MTSLTQVPARFNDSPARAERMAASTANRHLQLLVWTLRTAELLADAFPAEHDDDCPCGYCRAGAYIDLARETVGELGEEAGRAADTLENLIVLPADLDGDEFGQDFRHMAAFSDRLDADERKGRATNIA
jgi:hypothetical protein